MYNTGQIGQHSQAAYKLDEIMQAAFRFIRHNREEINEFAVKKFIKIRLKANNLISEKDNPIVAFGSNTSFIHYFARSKSIRQLQENDLALIDLWARQKEARAPYADITWMGFCGDQIPPDYQQKFKILIEARDLAVLHIRRSLEKGNIPIAGEIDLVVREHFGQYGLQKNFLHTTGHPLGITSAHGQRGGGIWLENKKPLASNLPYTIEPGIYFKNCFGLRSEIDFYIDDNHELIITSEPQKKLIQI